MTDNNAALLHRADEREVIDPEAFERWLLSNNMTTLGFDRGDYEMSFEQAQLIYVFRDPVLWCRAYMDDPDTHGQPWTFFDYQLPSVRAWNQDVVHMDGAEVGKTREIVSLILWAANTGMGFTNTRPWILVGAPQQTHLDEIIMAVEEHMGIDSEGKATGKGKFIHRNWLKPKKAPHTMFNIKTPTGEVAKIYFRPAGHDGEAFRGVHVNGLALMDEAAKIKGKTAWSEFRRAKKPGCKERIYSVPDGDNTTDYYDKTQQAIADLPPEKEGFRLFHWPKTVMPPPFYTPEREQKWRRDYGGRESAGYQRNVLGLNGQRESTVWPSHQIDRAIQDISGYRCVKFIGAQADDAVNIEVYKIQRGQTISDNDGTPEANHYYEKIYLTDTDETYSELNDVKTRRSMIARLITQHVTPLPAGEYVVGADLGETTDPTEIRIWQISGDVVRCMLRLHMLKLPYIVQCEVLFQLDIMLGHQANYGVDLGNAGRAVVSMLNDGDEYQDSDFAERLQGYSFWSTTSDVDSNGNLIYEIDKRTGEEVELKTRFKTLARKLVSTRLEAGTMHMPADPDVVNFYLNHTSREGQRETIFDKKNDHVLDADGLAMLTNLYSAQNVEAFQSSVNIR